MAKRVLSIDPGPVKSGWVLMDGEVPHKWGWDDNADLRELLTANPYTPGARCLLIEYPKPRGMPTSKEEMDTLFAAGRLVQAWSRLWFPVYRSDVKLALCGHARAKDTNIRQAIIDRYGGDSVAIGGKKCATCKGKGWNGRGRHPCMDCHCADGHDTVNAGMCGYETPPGVLHGITGHCWSALAVGLTYLAQQELK